MILYLGCFFFQNSKFRTASWLNIDSLLTHGRSPGETRKSCLQGLPVGVHLSLTSWHLRNPHFFTWWCGFGCQESEAKYVWEASTNWWPSYSVTFDCLIAVAGWDDSIHSHMTYAWWHPQEEELGPQSKKRRNAFTTNLETCPWFVGLCKELASLREEVRVGRLISDQCYDQRSSGSSLSKISSPLPLQKIKQKSPSMLIHRFWYFDRPGMCCCNQLKMEAWQKLWSRSLAQWLREWDPRRGGL